MAVNTTSNWNTARGGGGSNAALFGRGHTWVVQNAHSMTLSDPSAWDVSSTGKMQIESGGAWTNSSSGTVTMGTFQVDNGGTYTHSTTSGVPGTTKSLGSTSTLDFAYAGAQTVAALTYGHLKLSTSGTKTLAAGTTGIAGNLTVGGTAVGNATTNSATVDFNGGGAQNVGAILYHNLTFSNAGTKTFASGSTPIAGTFTISGSAAADATTNSSIINYNGAGAQTIRAINYHNLTLSTSGTKTFSAGTTGIASLFTIAGTATADATTNSSTISFNGSGAQNVNAITYYHLTVSGGNTKTAAGALTVNGDLTISGSTTLAAGSYTHVVQGNWSNSGTFTAGTSTVQLTGGSNTTISGSTTFNTLTVNKSSSSTTVTLNNATATGTLTMTQGKMVAGSNGITITSDRTGNGIITGLITRTHTFSASTAYAFEGPYNTLTFASGGTLPTSVSVTAVLSSPGANSDMEPIDRYYDISQTGGTGFSYTLRLHYEDSDVSSPNSETSPPLKLWRRTGTGPDTWTREGSQTIALRTTGWSRPG